ncbi:hypothetical protein [Deinococcus deserti]|uniref:hypothetical protein n=1 Tax=Deinococcus deserti TaxID=310783 RepID=UPI001392246E|nr:hypothetical protein [Deinococcus deserti]
MGLQRELTWDGKLRRDVQHQSASWMPQGHANHFTVRGHGEVRRVRVGIVS